MPSMQKIYLKKKIRQENKILTGIENLGNNLKDGAFFVGNKIKDAATEGYGFVKDKFNQNKQFILLNIIKIE